MESRPCRFSLCLQGGSVFADFDVDDHDQVVLCRISFDGFGCCQAPDTIQKMNREDSRTLIDAVDRKVVENPLIVVVLRTYIHEIKDLIWEDALAQHGLL